MPWILILKNIKYLGVAALIVAVVWFYKDWNHKKEEIIRIQENATQERMSDSVGYSQIILTKNETIEELKYNNPKLLEKLDELDIKMRRVQRLVNIRNNYRDTITQTTIIKEMPQAISEGREFTVPFKDSTECLVIYGVLHFNGQDLNLNVTDRRYKNEVDVIAHLERTQWRLLGIKTRLFGKRKVTVSVLNSCGETTTKIIDIKKK